MTARRRQSSHSLCRGVAAQPNYRVATMTPPLVNDHQSTRANLVSAVDITRKHFARQICLKIRAIVAFQPCVGWIWGILGVGFGWVEAGKEEEDVTSGFKPPNHTLRCIAILPRESSLWRCLLCGQWTLRVLIRSRRAPAFFSIQEGKGAQMRHRHPSPPSCHGVGFLLLPSLIQRCLNSKGPLLGRQISGTGQAVGLHTCSIA